MARRSQPPSAEQASNFFDLPNTGWSDLPHLPAGLPAEQLALLRQQRALNSWLHPAGDRACCCQSSGTLRRLASGCHRPGTLCCRGSTGRRGQRTANHRLRPARAARSRPAPRTDASQPTHSLFMCSVSAWPGATGTLSRAQIRSPFLHVDYFSRRWYADLPAIDPQTTFAGSQRQPEPARSAGSAYGPHYPGQPVPRRPCLFSHCCRSCHARRRDPSGGDGPARRRG